MNNFSKGEIDRLGNAIRDEKGQIKENTLVNLQNYRTSHKETLSTIFNFLCSISNRIHPETIVTYRIKRIESIIGKLYRYPDMRFSRMWDIGGCRCITRNNNDIYKIKKIISENSNFEIVKEKDYIQEPQKDGYKSLHLFIKQKESDKIIELQLRNQKDHNWATLVEITDLLYETSLKECGDKNGKAENKDLFRFHLLLSDVETIGINEKKEISQILKKYKYFERLSEVFSRNYIKVRKQWFEIESRNNHKFFLIETTKDDVPKITSFDSSINAEEQYFNVYKSNQNANIVLTHLHRPNYKQISIAYSNYILSFHSFLDDCLLIIESLISEAIEKKKLYVYYKTFHLYSSLVFFHIRNLSTEISEFRKYYEQTKSKKNKDKRKEREWIDDINRQLIKNKERGLKLGKKLSRFIPRNYIKRLMYLFITKYINNFYIRKIKKIK